MNPATFDTALPTVRRLTLLSDAKLRALWGLADQLAGVPGDCAELGVYRGGAGRLLALACPGRTVHLFDTFAGIPWDGYDASVDRHKPGEFPATLWEVRAALSDCPNIQFHPGLFPGTAVDGTFALVHLDADLYASTKAGLEWFWPRLSVGGAIVFDDYGWTWCPGVEIAAAEFFGGRTDARRVDSAEYQLTVFKT